MVKSAAQTGRLRSLLADISTITRMDEASQLIQKERVVLNDLIAEVTADMELKPADQRLRVNIDFPQQVEIVGSPSLLASIFRNLADNAAAYSGGRDIFIRLLSGLPPEEILKADMSKLDKTGLKDHLAPTRANALNSMAAQIKQAAMKMAEHH